MAEAWRHQPLCDDFSRRDKTAIRIQITAQCCVVHVTDEMPRPCPSTQSKVKGITDVLQRSDRIECVFVRIEIIAILNDLDQTQRDYNIAVLPFVLDHLRTDVFILARSTHADPPRVTS